MSSTSSTIAPEELSSPGSVLDVVLIRAVAVFGALTALCLLIIPKFFLPAEDAVILFQFSRNLALNGAITYVPFGPHAEGATDFAWMVLLSAGIKLGIDPFWLIAAINFISLILLAVLLLKIAGRKITPLPALFIMGAFALMPQIFAGIAGFSSLPFAVLLVLLTFCFLRQDDVAMPVVGLVLCLFRPDGVVFAVPMLIAALLVYPKAVRRAALDVALFVAPGLLYFAWRWHYFGQMLPLPFLVKSSAQRFAHLFVLTSVGEGILLLLFTLILLWFVLGGRLGGRLSELPNRAVLVCIVLLPNIFYFAMRLDQNIGRRFFIYLPVGAAILIAMNWQSIRPRAGFLLRLGLVAWIFLVAFSWIDAAKNFWASQFDNRKAIAMDLDKLPHGVMIATEAGILPYYSHWTAYDPWGLNTATFATRLFQPSDVAAIHPDLVMVYTTGDIECTPQASWQTPYTERTWRHLTRNIVTGADPAQYELWMLPMGSARNRALHHRNSWQGDQECWFVRRDSPLRSSLEGILSSHGGSPADRYRQLVSSQGSSGASGGQ